MHPTKCLLLASAAVFTLLLGPPAACTWAAPPVFDYKFAGTVTGVPAALASQFSVGEHVSGTFTVTQTASLPDHGGGPVSNFSANIGGDYPITSTFGGVDILNDFGGAIDAVKVDMQNLTAPTVAGHHAEYFSINLLYHGTAQLTSSNFLPQFVFGNFQDRSGLRFDANDALTVGFRLTDFSMIPEPAAAALLAVAIGIFPSARRFRRRPRASFAIRTRPSSGERSHRDD